MRRNGIETYRINQPPAAPEEETTLPPVTEDTPTETPNEQGGVLTERGEGGPVVVTTQTGVTEPEPEPVKEGSVAEVMTWVGDDSDRAKRALAKEKAATQPRSSLVTLLEKKTEASA